MVENQLPRMITRKNQHFLQYKEKHKNTKEAYTDGSKRERKKVSFTAVLTNIIRRGALPEEASICTAKITAITIA